MDFQDTFFSREDHYSLGIETESNRPYAAFPVTNGIVDYEENYELTREQYEHFLADHAAALAFVEEARKHEHDDLLMQKPGWNRGIPY